MWLGECLISTEHLMVHTAMPQALWPLYRQAEAPPHTGQVRQAIHPTQQLLCSAFHMLNIVSPEKDGMLVFCLPKLLGPGHVLTWLASHVSLKALPDQLLQQADVESPPILACWAPSTSQGSVCPTRQAIRHFTSRFRAASSPLLTAEVSGLVNCALPAGLGISAAELHYTSETAQPHRDHPTLCNLPAAGSVADLVQRQRDEQLNSIAQPEC